MSLECALRIRRCGSQQAVVWQSSSSIEVMGSQLSGSCQAVRRWLSGSCYAVARQLPGSCQAVIRQSSGSHQSDVRQLSGSRHAVVMQSSCSRHPVVRQWSSRCQIVKIYVRFVIHCSAYGTESLFSLVYFDCNYYKLIRYSNNFKSIINTRNLFQLYMEKVYLQNNNKYLFLKRVQILLVGAIFIRHFYYTVQTLDGHSVHYCAK